MAPVEPFSRISLALILNNLTNIFKPTRHVEQNKENKFRVTSSMYLYSDRSWATTNHNARSIHIIVKSGFKTLYTCLVPVRRFPSPYRSIHFSEVSEVWTT